MGLQVHLDRVFADNQLRQGPNIVRKSNFIINTGDNMSVDERRIRILQNKEKYGLTAKEIARIKLPGNYQERSNKKRIVVLNLEQIMSVKSNFSIVEKLTHLQNLKRAIIAKIHDGRRRKAAWK